MHSRRYRGELDRRHRVVVRVGEVAVRRQAVDLRFVGQQCDVELRGNKRETAPESQQRNATARHSTAQHSTAQQSTTQHSAAALHQSVCRQRPHCCSRANTMTRQNQILKPTPPNSLTGHHLGHMLKKSSFESFLPRVAIQSN